MSSANTGPSLLVDAAGVVRRSLPPGRAATLPVNLELRRGLTLYSRWGETPLALLGLSGIVISLRSRMRQS